MTQETILANARLVLEEEVRLGSIALRDGLISAIDSGGAVPRGAEDCEGAYLAPGLIELHTDNLERHLSPRPKANWPHRPAILAHDRELAGVGVTTVFDALRVGSILSEKKTAYGKYARPLASEILSMRAEGALAVSHHLHLRAEICSETLLEELDEFGPEDRVGIVSLMDHTPGQRQFRDVSKLEDYVRGKHNLTEEEFADHVAFLSALQARLGARHEAGAVAAARRFGATLASHDDATAGQVAVSAGHGVALAEFPTTLEAARASVDNGVAVIMGAPNVVRGGSHSGNVGAAELARAGLLDILSSDYAPSSLLLAATQLAALWEDLPRAIATVTASPARAVGLTDRGVLAPGRRADLLRFRMQGDTPAPVGVWAAGRRIA